MFSSIYKKIKASFVFLLIILNTLSIGAVFYALMPFKIIFWGYPEVLISRLFNFLATIWISINGFFLDRIAGVKINTDIPDSIHTKGWYLIVSNHQTWSDILILQRIFNKKAPFLKFFLKRQLIYVPVIGLVWWALDFPFMKRFSKQYLEKKPHMKGKDLETTIKACEKFAHMPVAVMNFPEGTRNRKGKAQKMNSPFKNLIRPKAGGFSFVLEAMDGKIDKIIDVTIHYSSKRPSLLEFLSGSIEDINVDVKIIDVEDWMVGSYLGDLSYRQRIQEFVNKLWEEKDLRLSRLSGSLKIPEKVDSGCDVRELEN
ncbi:MAG: acyltransferase [Desulforegulaceae bacterium]|nr:acyltransferase [Desulforegulaceae bacterium]